MERVKRFERSTPTLARLRALRSDLIDPTIAAHNGRVIKRTGIETLVEFRTVAEPAADIVREIDAEAQSNTHATRDVGCEVTALQQSSSQFEGTPP